MPCELSEDHAALWIANVTVSAQLSLIIDEMRQIIGWREHGDPISCGFRKMLRISCYKPGPCCMCQSDKGDVFRVWADMRP